MITIIDYGMGNLRSVQKALESQGAKARISQSPKDIKAADKLVLPGVGAMQPAMKKLHSLSLVGPIKDFIASERPFLGICLGLQLLFETSEEGGKVRGLGILKGNVKRFKKLKIPHMGWNTLKITANRCPLFTGITDKSYVYFCHSYFVSPKDKSAVAATTEYGVNFTSAIWKKNIYAIQFHPEKSQDVGLKILNNFVNL